MDRWIEGWWEGVTDRQCVKIINLLFDCVIIGRLVMVDCLLGPLLLFLFTCLFSSCSVCICSRVFARLLILSLTDSLLADLFSYLLD